MGEGDWTTLLAYFDTIADRRRFVADEPFSRLHTTIERTAEVDNYLRIRVHESHLRVLMGTLLGYNATPHIIHTEN